MSPLGELQRSFKDYVLTRDASVAPAVETTPLVAAEERLEVYAQAYRLRLRDALASSYPRLQALLGTGPFDTLAWQYIAAHPSQFASIRWFGDRLSALLRDVAATQPWLSELADWEWTLAAAFDAADAAPLRIEALAAITPDQWPGLRFDFHPSLRRLSLRTNAAAMFKALSEESPVPDPAQLAEPESWLLWRQELSTRYRSPAIAECAALDAMLTGATFAELCDLLCTWHEPEDVPLRAAGMLKSWLADGLIVAG